MGTRIRAWRSVSRAALGIVLLPDHLRRTVRIALVVGIVLTAINQFDVILAGEATALTLVKCGLNFCVPFIVSNLGLLTGRREELARAAATGAVTAGRRSPRRA